MNDTTAAASAGIGKLKAEWLDFAGNLAAPVLVLAAGGTKAQAAWAGLREVMMTKVLGPIGMVAGAASGFLMLTNKLIGEWKVMGVESAKAIETLTLQFKPLLGSMELAKKRAREVFAFSVKSPFNFADLAAGNKVLESLTRGALSSKAGMELVNDAAAVAGAGFEETARSVGRLYDGIMSGRPVGEAGMRLQELGLISGQTRNAIEAMTEANAAGSAIWAVVQRDMERTKGAGDDLSKSLEGLERTYADTRTKLEAGFGAGFMEGEKAGIESATAVLDAMTPVAERAGEMIGNLSNWWAGLKAKVIGSVTGFSGFTTVVGVAATAVVGLAASLTLATGGLIAKFALGILSAAAASRQLTASVAAVSAVQEAATGVAGALSSAHEAAGVVTDALTKAEEIQAAVTGSLSKAKAALAAMQKAVRAGSYAEAAGHMQVAAAQTVVAFKTSALAASQAILRGGMMLLMGGIKLVTTSLYQLSVAIMATPMFWIAAALVTAGAAMAYFYNEAKRAREELAALSAEAATVVSNLKQQALAIRTVADLRKAETETVLKLRDAYQKLAVAQGKGDKEAEKIAKKEAEKIEKVLVDVRDKSGKTVLSDEEVATEDAAKEQAKKATLAQGDERAGRGEQSALEVARERKAEGDRLRGKGELEKKEQERVAGVQEKSQRNVADQAKEEGTLLGQQATLREQITGMTDGVKLSVLGIREKEAEERESVEKKRLEEELEVLNDKLEALRKIKDLEESKVSRVALTSDSELVVLNEKLRIHAELVAAKQDEGLATQAFNAAQAEQEKETSGITGDVKPELRDKTVEAHKVRMAAIERMRMAEQAAVSAGVATFSPERKAQVAGQLRAKAGEQRETVKETLQGQRDSLVDKVSKADNTDSDGDGRGEKDRLQAELDLVVDRLETLSEIQDLEKLATRLRSPDGSGISGGLSEMLSEKIQVEEKAMQGQRDSLVKQVAERGDEGAGGEKDRLQAELDLVVDRLETLREIKNLEKVATVSPAAVERKRAAEQAAADAGVAEMKPEAAQQMQERVDSLKTTEATDTVKTVEEETSSRELVALEEKLKIYKELQAATAAVASPQVATPVKNLEALQVAAQERKQAAEQAAAAVGVADIKPAEAQQMRQRVDRVTNPLKTVEEETLQGQRGSLIEKVMAAGDGEEERLQKELDLVEERLETLREIREEEQSKVSKVALESDSELVVLQEKLKIISRLKEAKEQADTASSQSVPKSVSYVAAYKAADSAGVGWSFDHQSEAEQAEEMQGGIAYNGEEKLKIRKEYLAAKAATPRELQRAASAADWMEPKDVEEVQQRVYSLKKKIDEAPSDAPVAGDGDYDPRKELATLMMTLNIYKELKAAKAVTASRAVASDELRGARTAAEEAGVADIKPEQALEMQRRVDSLKTTQSTDTVKTVEEETLQGQRGSLIEKVMAAGDGEKDRLQEELDLVEQRLETLRKIREEEQSKVSKVALESDSELVVLQEKLKIISRLKEAKEQADTAKSASFAAEQAAEEAGVAAMKPEEAQEMRQRVDSLKTTQATDTVKTVEETSSRELVALEEKLRIYEELQAATAAVASPQVATPAAAQERKQVAEQAAVSAGVAEMKPAEAQQMQQRVESLKTTQATNTVKTVEEETSSRELVALEEKLRIYEELQAAKTTSRAVASDELLGAKKSAEEAGVADIKPEQAQEMQRRVDSLTTAAPAAQAQEEATLQVKRQALIEKVSPDERTDSEDELQVLKEKLRVYGELQVAKSNNDQAVQEQVDYRAAKGYAPESPDEQALRIPTEVYNQSRDAKAAAVSAGVADMKPEEAQQMQQRVDKGASRDADLLELAAVNERLKTLRKIKDLEESKTKVPQDDSELVALKEKLRIYEELQAAKLNDEKASQAVKDAASQTGGGGGAAGEMSPENEQQMQRRVKELKENQAVETDPVKKVAEEKAVRDAELGVTQARIDAESQVASLRLKGYEREKAMLGFEKQELEAKFKGEAIDQGAYEQGKKIIAAKEANMENAAGEKKQDLKDAFQLAALARKEQAARDSGDQGAADSLRAEQDVIKDEQTRRDATKEGQQIFGKEDGLQSDIYAEKAVVAAQEQRKQERAKQESGRELDRKRSEANQGSGVAELQSRTLQMQGKGKEAKKVKEDAARKQDEVNREEKKRSYIDQGFTGEKAKTMADTDVKTAQAERIMQEMMGNKGTVVASSLAQVGLGGNVAGTDPTVGLQEKMVELLKQIANKDENVTMMPGG